MSRAGALPVGDAAARSPVDRVCAIAGHETGCEGHSTATSALVSDAVRAVMMAKLLANSTAAKKAINSRMLDDDYGKHSGEYGYFMTPLHVASSLGYARTAMVLLDNGADPTAVDGSGNTVLCYACRYQHADALRLVARLLGAGSGVDEVGRSNRTPLVNAAKHGATTVVRILAASGADASLVDDSGRDALFHASSSGHADTARALLDMDGCFSVPYANSAASTRSSPVPFSWCHRECPSGSSPASAWGTALFAAARNLDVEVARVLISDSPGTVDVGQWVTGAAPGSRRIYEKKWKSPLARALEHRPGTPGRVEFARLCLEARANPDYTRLVDGATLLCVSAADGDAEGVRVLVANGADVRQCSLGAPPLYWAMRHRAGPMVGAVDCVKALAGAGAALNGDGALDCFDGWLPITYAVFWAHASDCQYGIPGRHSAAAEQRAVFRGIFQVLLEAGAVLPQNERLQSLLATPGDTVWATAQGRRAIAFLAGFGSYADVPATVMSRQSVGCM